MPIYRGMAGASWLFPEGVDRERLLDMDRRLRPVRRASFAVIAVALLACGPWLGWWTLIPCAIAAIIFSIADTRIDRTTHPERPVFAAWTASQAIIAISVALTGGLSQPTAAWFAIPMITLGARFSERGIAIGLAITVALIAGVGFGVDAQQIVHDPPLLIAPIAMVIAVAMMQTVVMRSDVETRQQAVIDPLTGMLNRKALEGRIAELRQQSQITGAPVGVLIGDLDHFKTINDRFGHAEGDAVLKDVAYALRRALRAFDLVYRIGGEEFLVLLPGADLTATADIAEGLRAAVAERPLGNGQNVTISLGISASSDGSWDYTDLFKQADEALYAAKAAGRDCVRGGASAESVSV
jgi:diguanylate cyclase (GGDEF)-like protein